MVIHVVLANKRLVLAWNNRLTALCLKRPMSSGAIAVTWQPTNSELYDARFACILCLNENTGHVVRLSN